MIFRIKKPKPKPLLKMIVPGRRALGEDWQEVTIAVQDDEIKVTESVAVAAPPSNRPVIVPGMGTLPPDAIDHILQGALKQQEYMKQHPRRRPVSDGEVRRMVQALWEDYCEQKLKALKGQTSVGAGGIFQREKPGITNWTGVNPR